MTDLPKPYIYDATEDTEGWTKEQMRDYGRANFELALVSDGDYIRAVISERDALRVENKQLRLKLLGTFEEWSNNNWCGVLSQNGREAYMKARAALENKYD